MNISGITPQDNSTPSELQKTTKQEKQDVDWGIFAEDGVISVEEQQEALRVELNSNQIIKDAVSKGLNLDTIIAACAEKFHDVDVVYKPLADSYINIAKKYVKNTLDVAVQMANDFIANLNNDNEKTVEKPNTPPNIYTEDFPNEEVVDYLIEKFESMGLEFGPNEIDGLSHIMASIDYDIDSNEDSVISVDEAKSHNYQYLSDYMNKDANGNPVDTHILDWMINKYLAKTKSEN